MSCDHGSTPRARECVGVLQIRRPVFLRTVVVVHVRRKLDLVDEPEMQRRQQGHSGWFFVTALWAVDCCCPSVGRHLEVIGAHRGAQASFLPRERVFFGIVVAAQRGRRQGRRVGCKPRRMFVA